MKSVTSENFIDAPISESVRKIDFTDAYVDGGFTGRSRILVVSGEKPYRNMEVRLSPLIYIDRPEYWGIEVIGIIPDVGLPATEPYTVNIPIERITGTRGIEVIGATKRERIDVPPLNLAENCNEENNVRYRAYQNRDGVFVIAEGTHPTSGFQVYFEVSPLTIYPPEFILRHRRPEGFVLQVITPFTATTSFPANEIFKEIIVNDAQGRHEIPVKQIPERRE